MVKKRHSVVLVHAAGVAMGDARRRAEAMAATLGGELLIARLGRNRAPRLSVWFPFFFDADAMLEVALREVRVLSRWSAARQRLHAPPLPAVPVDGDDHLLEICRGRDVELVVLPMGLSHRAAWIARRAGVAVLLAHSASSDRVDVLAATDLTRPERPVMRRAGALAERLRTQLTVVHNLPGFAAQLIAAGLGATTIVMPDDDAVASEQERLLKAEVSALGLPADVKVTRRLDTASGILEAATERNVDLIVVGAPRPHLFGHRVCERLCTVTDRSILLVPV